MQKCKVRPADMHAAATCCEPRGQKRSVTAQLIETVVMLLTAQLRATLCYSFEVISRGLLMLMAGHTILRSDIQLSDKLGQHIPHLHPAWVRQDQHENICKNMYYQIHDRHLSIQIIAGCVRVQSSMRHVHKVQQEKSHATECMLHINALRHCFWQSCSMHAAIWTDDRIHPDDQYRLRVHLAAAVFLTPCDVCRPLVSFCVSLPSDSWHLPEAVQPVRFLWHLNKCQMDL